jgi:hypothetical protein
MIAIVPYRHVPTQLPKVAVIFSADLALLGLLFQRWCCRFLQYDFGAREKCDPSALSKIDLCDL